MRIAFIYIQNFRKLYRCRIDFSKDTTLFVGANNSGKTSAMDALAKFLKDNPLSPFSLNDFTLTNLYLINQIGNKWVEPTCEKPDSLLEWSDLLPSIDIWLDVYPDNIHHVVDLIPTLKWRGGLLGVRLIYQPKNIETPFYDYRNAFKAARETEQSGEGKIHTTLFPKNLCDFIDRHINSKKQANSIFTIKSYLLDPEYAMDELPQKTDFDMQCLSDNPLKAIIRVDIIPAQRGLSDEVDHTQLSSQMRGYYDKHLNPEKHPTPEDLDVLEATESSRTAFDKSLESKFRPAIRELEGLGYPGVENPQITIASKISAKDTLRHDSAVQYSLGDELMLPEKYNGLGYQNLISVVFDLISFRDGWMRKGKAFSSPEAIEPLHLVLVEEPEAHLHMQVQQVFIRKAYSVLRNHEKLGGNSLFTTQLIISTHSSHIAREVDFEKLRYFKRLPRGFEIRIGTSKVVNLCSVFGTEDETARFVTRYLRTTHCDLFFADAAILVEGSSEFMLLPHFIRNKYQKLDQMYITVLSINGRYSYRLAPLLNALALPTLVVTDLDSAKPTGHHEKVIPKRNAELISSNYAITGWLIKKKMVDELLDLKSSEKIFSIKSPFEHQIRIAYQIPVHLKCKGRSIEALPRTFEDSLIYNNWDVFANNQIAASGWLICKIRELLVENELLEGNDLFEKIQKSIFEELQKSNVKAEFALDLIYSMNPTDIVVPDYIDEGLSWLEGCLYTEE